MAKKNLVATIGGAIKHADKSFFNEDYAKQGAEVIATLRREGFEIVPKTASDELVEFLVENMPYGQMKPEDLMRALYQLMVENARRLG
ncbi:MAG: hypothetical protein KI792_11595 [Alphaproteobacteria bacterium]|nr:hypothetical protein [Alphaproteobacteria bacterium SS10]